MRIGLAGKKHDYAPLSEYAKELAQSTWCSLQLHPRFRQDGKLPLTEQILFIPASVNDITVYEQAWSTIKNRTFFGGKVYMDNELNQQMIIEQNSEMSTLLKK